MHTIIPVILCGGSGTRLWPRSRKSRPKQFLRLVGENSLFQDTLLRIESIPGLSDPIIVTNEDHRFLASQQLLDIGTENFKIILEPCAKNTAPAIALAAIEATKVTSEQKLDNSADPILLVLPSDHIIGDAKEFADKITKAIELAQDGFLVTFGVVPAKAETGYGYIEKGEGVGGFAHAVRKFEEKPNAERAKAFLESGNHLWNSGMFMFKASTYLHELAAYQPAIHDACKEALNISKPDHDFVRPNAELFEISPEKSIDYAVMEKTSKAVVIELDAQWNDLGSWDSLWGISDKDADSNSIQGNVVLHNMTRSYVTSQHRLVAAIGLSDVLVVETKDAVLVSHKSSAQDLKKLVEKLNQDNKELVSNHREVIRPWGKYDSVDSGEGFQVKRITVNPGASLSRQKHFRRAEHWVVVSGIAEVECDDNVFDLAENESTYIPLGSVHRLTNKQKEPLRLIEVQTGNYLGEDDIVRLDDVYGR